MVTEKSVLAVIRASRPGFRNFYDKAAFVVHASFLAEGYFLTATGRLALSNDALSSSSTDEVGIDRWNEVDDSYAFVYVHPEKGLKKVLVKCLVMNDKLLVDALAKDGAEPVHVEINVGDYVVENEGKSYAEQFKNLDKLVKSLTIQILSNLDNPLTTTSSENASRWIPEVLGDKREEKISLSQKLDSFDKTEYETGWSNLLAEERSLQQKYPKLVDKTSLETEGSGLRTNEPHVSDGEHQVPPPSSPRLVYPAVPDFGRSDLFPGPGAGMYPTRGGFGSEIGGGMLLGPNDPSWFGGTRGGPLYAGPPPGVPPGARFDPYGPPNVPGFEPNRFTRNPRRPGDEVHPDLEHFRSGGDFI